MEELRFRFLLDPDFSLLNQPGPELSLPLTLFTALLAITLPLMKTTPSPRCLFVDDHHVGEIHQLTRNLNRPQKHPSNPILKPERPWEGKGIWSKNATLWDSDAEEFRMWYAVSSEGGGHRACIAKSSDGVSWERPDLGLVAFDGSRNNNLLDAEVFQLVHGADDRVVPPADELYRCVSWSHEKGQHLLTSANGLQWSASSSIDIFGAGDTFLLTKGTRPLTGRGGLPGYPSGSNVPRYIGAARWCVGVGRFDGSSDTRPTRRVQALLRSEDLRNWSDPVRILTPDSLDDQMAMERIELALSEGWLQMDNYTDRRCEFYTLLVIPYEDLYIGMLLVFDACYENHRHGSANQQGPGHWQLVASRDLLTWERLGGRAPFIPRGRPDEFDCGLAWYSSLPVVVDDTMWFFYAGNQIGHGTMPEYERKVEQQFRKGAPSGFGCIGAARLRRDGWVSLDADAVPGHLLTRTIQWPEQGELHLNVDASGGRVVVSICQPDGTPYPGFDASEAITGDHCDTSVRFPDLRKIPNPWGGPQTHGTLAETGPERLGTQEYESLPRHWKLQAGLPARIRIAAQNAKLFSYWFA